MFASSSGDPTHSASHWLSASRPPLALPPGVRTALHQSAVLGLSWCEQLAVAQNQHWQRLGIARKTVWKYGAAAITRSLRAHRLSASTLSWAGGFTGSVGFSFREAIADGHQALAEAASINAETVVIAPGDRNGHTYRHARRLVVDGLKALVDDAADRQISLAVLVNPPAKLSRWSHLAADDHALELLDDVGSPWVGLASPLLRWDSQPAMMERWQRVMQRSWLVWTNAEHHALGLELRSTSLEDTLKRLSKSGFSGIWELRSQATRATATSREQRDYCRAVSEALGLPNAARPGNVLI